MSLGAGLRGAVLTATLAALLLPARAEQPASDGWRPFTATWTLSGQSQILPTEGPRPASIVKVQGPMIITAGEGLGRGFLVEMIGFDDGAALVVGRSVLTDERGDRIYSTVHAEPIETGRRGTGTITGGSGRYAGIEGVYTFTWEYAVDAGNGEISIRSVDLKGRTRRASPAGREPSK